MPRNIRIAPLLLKWYDKNARDLPWRVPPIESQRGIKPNPYHIWLSEVMLQQTTVKVVKKYYEYFLLRWPTITDLASANKDDIMEAWAGLGYYNRARNLMKCARIIKKTYGGKFPKDKNSLLNLPGVGDYTAAAMQSIGFNLKANVIDGNVERIISRLFAINTPIISSKKLIKSFAENINTTERFGDYAQALMDLGSEVCTPREPRCDYCPVKQFCKSNELGLSDKIPFAAKKRKKPTKYGFAFIAFTRKDNFILERRPDKGLLGGMLCLPTSQWLDTKDLKFEPPFETEWELLNESVSHVFSHFHLELKIARGYLNFVPKDYIVRPVEKFDRETLPSLMRKVFDIGVK